MIVLSEKEIRAQVRDFVREAERELLRLQLNLCAADGDLEWDEQPDDDGKTPRQKLQASADRAQRHIENVRRLYGSYLPGESKTDTPASPSSG